MKDIHDESTWPVWANEKINIVQPNPDWIRQGEQEKMLLLEVLSQVGITEIEHYGSTSIPSLPAKPIIDLMAKMESFEKVIEVSRLLEPYHWHYVPPELDNRPWQRFFVKVLNDKRVAHLHIVREGEGRWDKHLLFRDRLRSNAQFRNEYANLKGSLAERYSNDREEYTKAKTEFINKVLHSTR